ncbi:5'-3' exonuclease [Evansella cellulosilytica]|uniref:5'-3' exonuclease n=1 Tax=Evansella cellulosilytica (strain ATCC 21833 / DSM 2522 / FERM P-1141 / JCM 9156 / N-4) TaxID=649639 RepID=E6U1T8_EVAC2|nr:5'-3' exonuclease H3TH domain-containing protein [Evansella cellulosilytica]ADU31585.1 5'-3' exonuclease, N-terminal resolvase-like domain [Evansella cellulosilytica DSM 2522]
MKNKVMLVDGMALLFRAFYATAMSGYFMVNSKGVPTNAIHGFIKHLFTAVNTYKPTHVICCWDMGSKTFRTELFPDYKGNRGEPPVELIPQFDLVKDVVDALDIPNVGLAGFEADDCIGTLAQQFKEESEVLILTGDQDILQLIDENVHVVLLKKGYGNYALYKEDVFLEEKGITPPQMVDLKALMGDSSDNYPGVKGIGEKTALQLLKKYGTIEGILENLPSLTKAQRNKIETDLDMLHLSRKLAKIHCEVEVSCPLNTAAFNVNRTKMIEKFTELEFKNIDSMIS